MNAPIASPIARIVPWVAGLAAIVWAIASAIITFWSVQGARVDFAPDYAEHALFLVGVVLVAVALTGLQHRQGRRAGRLARVGQWLIIVGIVALAASAATGLVTGNDAVIGPAYPIGALVSRLGFILWGIAAYRAAVLPRWLGPVVALGWLIAPPLSPNAAAFALALSWAATAFAMRQPAASHQPSLAH